MGQRMTFRTVTSVFFDRQFWVALVERWEADGSYSAARHVFGEEPSNAELLRWAGLGFGYLRFVPGTAPPVTLQKVNPKRLRRQAAKELRGLKPATSATEALKAELSLRKQSGKHYAASDKVKEDLRFHRQQDKLKKRRRGH
jgi:hypothetical protein